MEEKFHFMEPNKIPSSEDGWNSDDPVLPGMSCAEAARYLTVFTSAFRAFIEAERSGSTLEVLKCIERLMVAQQHLVKADDDYSDQRAILGLSAIGLAMASLYKVDPRLCGELTNQALKSLMEVTEQKGPDIVAQMHARFFVAQGDYAPEEGVSRMKVAMALVPMEEVQKKVLEEQDKQKGGNKILRLFKGLKPNG